MKDEIRTIYEEAYLEYGDSPAGVLWPKARQDIRFDALTRNIRLEGDFSLLDFGSGLAHLKEYLDSKYRNVIYSGVEMQDFFLEASNLKYPECKFYNFDSPSELNENFDYIVSSGAFNLLYTGSEREHKEMVFRIIKELHARSNIYCSFNFMSDDVDFKQDGAYHQNVGEILNYVSNNLSKRVAVDCSYMPYEFTITVWRDQKIKQPENIYGS
jgi:cyclopropane fatty-acyl-phospholipid synthase-like methyltransferase